MQDAMTIWDSICHSQWFKHTSIVRYLNLPLYHLSNHLLDPISEQERSFRAKNPTFTHQELFSCRFWVSYAADY